MNLLCISGFEVLFDDNAGSMNVSPEHRIYTEKAKESQNTRWTWSLLPPYLPSVHKFRDVHNTFLKLQEVRRRQCSMQISLVHARL